MKKERLEAYRKIIPNSVILAPDEKSLLKLECWQNANRRTLPNPERYLFSLIKQCPLQEITPEVINKTNSLFKRFHQVTIDPNTYTDFSNYFLKHPEETILRLRYSHPLVTDAYLRLNAPFNFPESIRKTDTIIPGYLEEIQFYPSEIILATAPFNNQFALTKFKEPLTLELLTTF